jgi:hypothetical protein
MSRSGYSDEYSPLWRGSVERAIRGKRGQAFLRDLLAALDAMPEKTLAADSLVTAEGEFCTLGVLGAARGIDLETLDPDDPEQVAKAFGIAEAMAREIVFENDEHLDDDYQWVDVEICGPMRPWNPEWGRHRRHVRVQRQDGPQRRWARMRAWVVANLREEASHA